MRRPRDQVFARNQFVACVLICTVLSFIGMSGALASEAEGAAASGDPTFRITREVIAGGGVTHASSACFDLSVTIAEPVAGTAAGGVYALTAGFWSDPASIDSIFRSSFEDCQP